MDFAKLIQLLFAIAPSVIDIMQKVETSAPGPGVGAVKKDAVMGVVNAAATVAQAASLVVGDTKAVATAVDAKDAQTAAQGISVMIDHFASAFNQLGVFQKSSLVKNAKPLTDVAAPR